MSGTTGKQSRLSLYLTEAFLLEEKQMDQTASGQLYEVAQRIHEMRDIFGYSTQKMAELTEIPESLY